MAFKIFRSKSKTSEHRSYNTISSTAEGLQTTTNVDDYEANSPRNRQQATTQSSSHRSPFSPRNLFSNNKSRRADSKSNLSIQVVPPSPGGSRIKSPRPQQQSHHHKRTLSEDGKTEASTAAAAPSPDDSEFYVAVDQPEVYAHIIGSQERRDLKEIEDLQPQQAQQQKKKRKAIKRILKLRFKKNNKKHQNVVEDEDEAAVVEDEDEEEEEVTVIDLQNDEEDDEEEEEEEKIKEAVVVVAEVAQPVEKCVSVAVQTAYIESEVDQGGNVEQDEEHESPKRHATIEVASRSNSSRILHEQQKIATRNPKKRRARPQPVQQLLQQPQQDQQPQVKRQKTQRQIEKEWDKLSSLQKQERVINQTYKEVMANVLVLFETKAYYYPVMSREQRAMLVELEKECWQLTQRAQAMKNRGYTDNEEVAEMQKMMWGLKCDVLVHYGPLWSWGIPLSPPSQQSQQQEDEDEEEEGESEGVASRASVSSSSSSSSSSSRSSSSSSGVLIEEDLNVVDDEDFEDDDDDDTLSSSSSTETTDTDYESDNESSTSTFNPLTDSWLGWTP